MREVPPKYFLGLIAILLATISAQLIPLTKQASRWNSCLKKTSSSLSQVKAFQKIDDQSKEVISVMICNGAVFEPKIKSIVK